jgi:hypothetical protein
MQQKLSHQLESEQDVLERRERSAFFSLSLWERAGEKA